MVFWHISWCCTLAHEWGRSLCLTCGAEDAFLDLVIGIPILKYNHSFKAQTLDPDSGEVVSLVDDYKYIKMDVLGPNIVEVHHIKVPYNIKVLLQKNL